MLALVVGAPCGRRRVFRSAGDRPGAGWRGYARRRAPGPGDRARGPGAARPGHPRRRPGGPWRSRTLTLTLTFSSVMSRSRIDCNATAANASLISNRSTSAGVLPSRPNALRIALAGWHSSDGSGPATTPCPRSRIQALLRYSRPPATTAPAAQAEAASALARPSTRRRRHPLYGTADDRRAVSSAVKRLPSAAHLGVPVKRPTAMPHRALADRGPGSTLDLLSPSRSRAEGGAARHRHPVL